MAKEGRLNALQLVDAVNKKFGAGTMVVGTKADGLVKPRISTGSLSLDIVLGGGYPEGAVEIMEGEEGVSKSWNLHTRAANFLNKYPQGVYILINAEGTNDPPFLDMLGCDLSRTFFIQPDSGENAWDIAHEIAGKAEKAYIGIDSLDAMVPLQEVEGDMDEHKMAPAARMNNKGFRKLIALMRSDIETQEHRVTMGIITQLRTNIGVMYGDNKTSVGGKGKQFAAMTIVRYRRKQILRTEGKTVLDRIAYGMVIEADVIKNKGTGQGEKVQFTLYKENYEGFKRGQIDNVTELIPFLLRYKIIEKKGAWIVFPDGDKFQGEDKAALKLRQDDVLREKMCQMVKDEVAKRHQTSTPSSASKAVAARKRLPRGRKDK